MKYAFGFGLVALLMGAVFWGVKNASMSRCPASDSPGSVDVCSGTKSPVRHVFLKSRESAQSSTDDEAYTLFESTQFRPLAMSPDGRQLFAVNTPDNRLEIFDITDSGLEEAGSVSVGLEPVAVAARNNAEVWVVNHLSDSVSIVAVSGDSSRVIRTLLVGDEPNDIVFAGKGNERAFISAAHRGQNSPYNDPLNPGEMTTPGIGRADIWVFDAQDQGTEFGGTPLDIVVLFGDSPGALAVTPNGNTVYASVFKSGNQTTALGEDLVCDGGSNAGPCEPVPGELASPGGLPPPNRDKHGVPQPEVGLIVKYDGNAWRDELGRDWNGQVRFGLPDYDVFSIDATDAVPRESASFSGVGTVLFGMAVNPSSGKIYVSNTDARNHVRFLRPHKLNAPNLRAHTHEARITIIDPVAEAVVPRHLNKHLDYEVWAPTKENKDASLASPMGIAVSPDGSTLYLAANGSNRIGVFHTEQLENNKFVPDSASHIQLSGGGPTGLVLDPARNRLYVLTRFDNTVSVISTEDAVEAQRIALYNPEPEALIDGRLFHYDSRLTSNNGEASCNGCHVSGHTDGLSWDLGNPMPSYAADYIAYNLNPFVKPSDENPSFHPMKGPMRTQTMRGIATHGPMHHRGDQTAGGALALDEKEAFLRFVSAFNSINGRWRIPFPSQMDLYTSFALKLTMPPNPIRNLDDSLNSRQKNGQTLFESEKLNCSACHILNLDEGFFGTDGKSTTEPDGGSSQAFKIPHLRSMYDRVGMFGRPDSNYIKSGENEYMGDQIRGFGFLHDGSIDTLWRFNHLTSFPFPGEETQYRDVEQYLLAFDSDLKPIVGQQVTLGATSDPAAIARLDLLISRALAGDADLVVKGLVAGEQRGWIQTEEGLFRSDSATETDLTDDALRALARANGQELTYTAVPPGSGFRIGIDRDMDEITDNNDNCPTIHNPGQGDANENQVGDDCEDTDEDGMNNAWEIRYSMDPFDPTDAKGDIDKDGLSNISEYLENLDPEVPDMDGDGLADGYEVEVLGTNPFIIDTDDDALPDAWESLYGTDPLHPDSRGSDPDNDQYSNLEEYRNGTNPRVFDEIDPENPPSGWAEFRKKYDVERTKNRPGQRRTDI